MARQKININEISAQIKDDFENSELGQTIQQNLAESIKFESEPLPSIKEMQAQQIQKFKNEEKQGRQFAYNQVIESNPNISENVKKLIKNWIDTSEFADHEILDIANNKFGKNHQFDQNYLYIKFMRDNPEIASSDWFKDWSKTHKFSDNDIFEFIKDNHNLDKYILDYANYQFEKNNSDLPKYLINFGKSVIGNKNFKIDDQVRNLIYSGNFSITIPDIYKGKYGKILIDNNFHDLEKAEQLIKYYETNYYKTNKENSPTPKGFQNFLKKEVLNPKGLQNRQVLKIYGYSDFQINQMFQNYMNMQNIINQPTPEFKIQVPKFTTKGRDYVNDAWNNLQVQAYYNSKVNSDSNNTSKNGFSQEFVEKLNKAIQTFEDQKHPIKVEFRDTPVERPDAVLNSALLRVSNPLVRNAIISQSSQNYNFSPETKKFQEYLNKEYERQNNLIKQADLNWEIAHSSDSSLDISKFEVDSTYQSKTELPSWLEDKYKIMADELGLGSDFEKLTGNLDDDKEINKRNNIREELRKLVSKGYVYESEKYKTIHNPTILDDLLNSNTTPGYDLYKQRLINYYTGHVINLDDYATKWQKNTWSNYLDKKLEDVFDVIMDAAEAIGPEGELINVGVRGVGYGIKGLGNFTSRLIRGGIRTAPELKGTSKVLVNNISKIASKVINSETAQKIGQGISYTSDILKSGKDTLLQTIPRTRQVLFDFTISPYYKPITFLPKFALDTTKYVLTHPVESFVLPPIIRKGIAQGFDRLDNDFNINTPQKIRDFVEIVGSGLGSYKLANAFRNRYGTNLYDLTLNEIESINSNLASKLENNNTFRNLFFSDLGYTRSTSLPTSQDFRSLFTVPNYIQGIKTDWKNIYKLPIQTLKSNKVFSPIYGIHLIGRNLGPNTTSALLLGSQSFLPNGNISDTLQEQFNMNPFVADTIDYGFNAVLNHNIQKNFNMWLNQPVMKMKQTSGGAQTQSEGFKNMYYNWSNTEKMSPDHYVVKHNGHDMSYQLIYELSPTQVNKGIYKTKLYSHETSNSSVYNLETKTGFNTTLKVGDKLLDNSVEVSAILPIGSKRVTNNIESELGRQLVSRANRYQKGQDVIVIKTSNSESIPSIKEMEKSKDWVTLTLDGETLPIKKGMDIPMIGVYGDFQIKTNPDGSRVYLNPGGHQLSFFKNIKTNEIYAVQIDLSGTGSTTRGSSLGIVSDSAQHPYILSKITKIDPTIPIQDQLGLISVANRTELPGTFNMITKNLFTPQNMFNFYGKYTTTKNGKTITKTGWFPKMKDQVNENIKNMTLLNKEYKNSPFYYQLTSPTSLNKINNSENYGLISTNKPKEFWRPVSYNEYNIIQNRQNYTNLMNRLNNIIKNNN